MLVRAVQGSSGVTLLDSLCPPNLMVQCLHGPLASTSDGRT